jgi:hypothetical protein
MSSKLASILGLSSDEEQTVDKPLSSVSSLSEWLSETVEATKDTPLFQFLGSTGEAAKEWSGTLKAVGKLIEKLTKEASPQVLGWLACTIAYRRASEEAIRAYGRPATRIPYSGQVVSERLRNLRLDDPSIMEGFSLASAASHPFLRAADVALTTTLEAAGYDAAERRNLLRSVRAAFKGVLQDVLSGEQKEKFANFTQWLQLDTDDQRLNAMLLSHAELQRAELEDQAALGIEPFSIADVYIEGECGALPWSTIRDRIEGPSGTTYVDPFSEDSAPRRDLMATVLELMSDKKFNDAIIIQGAPGSGKSTFTKSLCVRLHRDGLIPVRIPLQHIRVDANILDAIQEVLSSFSGQISGLSRRDLLPEKVFTERVPFNGTDISPYVFIFDGWDEISLSAAEGFQQRVERLLDSIRQAFLSQIRNRVRVVLTGRPSQAVGHSNFLRDDTPVLTMRPIRPEQLTRYIAALRTALEKPAFEGDEIDVWALGELERYQPVLTRYEKAFPRVGTLEVLGQPLLAHLAVKVMASFKGDLSQLITPPTTLYRHLVDLTCKRGGKYPTQSDRAGQSGRIVGDDLRTLLHGTALAITAHGSESIPTEELELRLETLGVGMDAFRVTKEHPLTNLMISFFFKGNEQAGCEFLHKSFREYLAAEAIVEVLKEYGRTATTELEEKPDEQYWQDFSETDPRWWLSRKLGEMLSAQLISREITTHLSGLLRWEIERATSKKEQPPLPKAAGICTKPITVVEWGRVRDALADLWDWWGEGVHLRPQPKEKQKIWRLDDEPFVIELVGLAMRRYNYNRRNPPRPLRTVTIDANLGYGLFQLTSLVHSFLSETLGWMGLARALGPAGLWKGTSAERPRRYQVSVACQGLEFVQFAPSGSGSKRYFSNYASRINAAGFLAQVPFKSQAYRADFPSRTHLRGCYLAGADLKGLSFSEADMTSCSLEGAILAESQLLEANLSYTNMQGASLFSAHIFNANLDGADLTGAGMFLADLRGTSLRSAGGLSQEQLNYAIGMPKQFVPEPLVRPDVWKSFEKRSAAPSEQTGTEEKPASEGS